MKYFLATTDKQLGVCLRMLYAEKLQPIVETVMNGKGKIEFHVHVTVGDNYRKELEERYNILIS